MTLSAGLTNCRCMSCDEVRRYNVAQNRDLSSAASHLKDTSQSCPLENNNYDCGDYTLWFAERLARGEQEMVLEPAFTPVQWKQHILSVVSNRRMGFGEYVRAERGVPPKRTTTSKTICQRECRGRGARGGNSVREPRTPVVATVTRWWQALNCRMISLRGFPRFPFVQFNK